ncbi:MAG: MerR family transcriptional regulator [Spirochaetota bacterium]
MEKISIGQLSRSTGMTLRTIRYYEEIGLISACNEKLKNSTLYPAEAHITIKKIQILKEAGLSLDEIKSIFRTIQTRNTKEKQLTLFLREALEDARKKIKEKTAILKNIEKSLQTALTKTSLCTTCKTTNQFKDCEGCTNLSTLKDFGLKKNLKKSRGK